MQDESRLQSLKGTTEGSAYLTKGQRNPGQFQGQNPRKGESEKVNRENLVCNYCKRVGHTKEKCYQLHLELRPPHIQNRVHLAQSQQGGASNSAPEGTPSTLDLMQELQKLKLMINNSGTTIGSTSMANSGINEFLSSLSIFTKNYTKAWILDFGATDHMTPRIESFVSYTKIAPGKQVQTADGSLLPMIGVGHMNIQPTGNLTNVLHVPKLFVSLISVQKLAKM